LPWDGDLGHLKPWLTTFAPILISFSFKLVSDQSVIGSGGLIRTQRFWN
jgi:hypothetical protein